eukprot:gene3881-2753_t
MYQVNFFLKASSTEAADTDGCCTTTYNDVSDEIFASERYGGVTMRGDHKRVPAPRTAVLALFDPLSSSAVRWGLENPSIQHYSTMNRYASRQQSYFFPPCWFSFLFNENLETDLQTSSVLSDNGASVLWTYYLRRTRDHQMIRLVVRISFGVDITLLLLSLYIPNRRKR